MTPWSSTDAVPVLASAVALSAPRVRDAAAEVGVWSTRAGRFVSLLADRALHFVPADPIVRRLGDQPPVSETATVIPARGATGLSMAIIAAPAFSSGMRSAISSRRSSRPSVIIASMAG